MRKGKKKDVTKGKKAINKKLEREKYNRDKRKGNL